MSTQAQSRTQVQRVSDRELQISRFFNAKPESVFDAFTQVELLKRWWAPRSLGVQLFDCVSEVHEGGKYRFVFGRPGEPAMAFSGVYRELKRGERIVYTQIFEPMPDTGEGLITMVLTAQNGGTMLVSNELYPSKDVLDGAIASGMEKGMRETLEQLEALLAELA